MKKILTLTFGCILAVSTFAQTSGIKFGVKVGVNLAKTALTGSDYGTTSNGTFKSDLVTSFHFSGLVDIPVSSSFSVQPGLSLTGKGTKLTNSTSGTIAGAAYTGKVTGTMHDMYLEIPVHLVYKINSIYFGAGPYAAFALAGKATDNETSFTSNGATQTIKGEDRDLKFGNDPGDANSDGDDLKSSDFGLSFLAGYQLKNGVNIGAGYGLGLTNLTPKGTAKDKTSNRVISFSVGFMF
jgi:Outer membrane protein beta-barrel domain